MENVKYHEYELELNAGDTLFVYTDGVPEATNTDEELYGTDRMIDTLNKNADAAPNELLTHLKADIASFVGEAPQFDDITMLALKIKSR
jgi:sigma-B regulation protein RsbU (phosphoserine phosphatase)